MAIKANVWIEGFRLDQAYCRVASAELRRSGGALVCDCVVDILSASGARAPIQKKTIQNIVVSDDGTASLRRQIYVALKHIQMFADAEDV